MFHPEAGGYGSLPTEHGKGYKMTESYVLIFAYMLDIIIGDPRQIPHPVRIIGWAVNKAEGQLRMIFKKTNAQRFGGILLVFTITGGTYLISHIINQALIRYSEFAVGYYVAFFMLSYLVSTTLATRELIKSAESVIDLLINNKITDARTKLSLIVGRDTENLDKNGISKATIETLAENASDGIVAPIFYFLIGGLPLAMTYKAVNTLDSMVGYKNAKYKDFGWASARLDDIANFVPARITGVLIVMANTVMKLMGQNGCKGVGALKIMLRDGRKHASPNSGMPEAAMAGALGVSLGGPSMYDGVIIEKPFIGEERLNLPADRQGTDYLRASKEAVILTKITSFLGLFCALAGMGLWK
jgi:adenosylcobinamide-phosphate synthase